MPVRKPALMTQEERDAEAHARAEAHANDVLRAEVGAIYQELHLNTRAHPRECLLALRESLAVMRPSIAAMAALRVVARSAEAAARQG